MPYVYGAVGRRVGQRGHPVLRTLFFEYPNDPTSWLIEDEYMFGSDLLVAPLIEDEATGRRVYVPPGTLDRLPDAAAATAAARWHEIAAGDDPDRAARRATAA